MDNKQLAKRFEAVRNERNIVQHTWDVVARFVMPYRGRFFKINETESSIEWSKREVYDSTAIQSHKILSSTLFQGLTSPASRWFDMRFRDEELNKSNAPMRWIQEVSDRVFYELQDSNFNLNTTETFEDVCGFGTGCMTLQPEDPSTRLWSGLDFSSVPLKECYFEPDNKGRTMYFYRLLRWTPAQIVAKFGDKVPQVVKDKLLANDQGKCDVLYVVWPRKPYDYANAMRVKDMGAEVKPSRRPFGEKYIFLKSHEDLGKEGGYYEMPAFTPRWATVSESMWGHSPATIALADILSLNEARKMQLRMAEKMIDPPILANERALLSSLDMTAGSLNSVRDKDGIEAFESGGSFTVSDAMVDILQQSVRNYFYVDQLQFPAPQAQPMTATEAAIRLEQMQRLMSTPLGRLQNDLLTPIVSRTVRMLARAGELPEVPQEVLDKDAHLDIEYMGSIARAQSTDRTASIERMLMTVGNLAEIMPKMLDNIDQNEAVRQIARDLNIPASMLKDENEVESQQATRDQQAENLQTAETLRVAGEAQQAVGAGQQAMEGVNAEAAGGPEGNP